MTGSQVQFSLVDTRPLTGGMSALCSSRDVGLLTYGSLMGGLLTDSFLRRPEPLSEADLPTPSLGKYFGTLRQWGSWALFQELLEVLRDVADRHSEAREAKAGTGDGGGEGAMYFSVANVAVKWVLDQKAVAGVIIGLRAGLSEHSDSNLRALELDLASPEIYPEGLARISSVLARGRSLLEAIGDCGDEYRRR